jgi:hypothetical protein
MGTAAAAHLAHAREVCGEVVETRKYSIRAKELITPDPHLTIAPFNGNAISADPTAIGLLFEASQRNTCHSRLCESSEPL